MFSVLIHFSMFGLAKVMLAVQVNELVVGDTRLA